MKNARESYVETAREHSCATIEVTESRIVAKESKRKHKFTDENENLSVNESIHSVVPMGTATASVQQSQSVPETGKKSDVLGERSSLATLMRLYRDTVQKTKTGEQSEGMMSQKGKITQTMIEI